jgi:gluconokinase
METIIAVRTWNLNILACRWGDDNIPHCKALYDASLPIYMSSVTITRAEPPFVLALDVGTSSVRAGLYDAVGRSIDGAESRTQYQMQALADGGVEIEADELVETICQTVDHFLVSAKGIAPEFENQLCAVASSTFWHAMIGIDRDGRHVTPLYNWSDTRSAPDAAALGERLGVDWIHDHTGVVPHASYYPAKILWLRRTQPSLASRVARWVSIGEYLYLRVLGRLLCGVSMASGTGLFNPNLCDWDSDMLRAIEVDRDHLSPLAEGKKESGLTGMRPEFASRWPALSRLPWFPSVGDGACGNVGSGCVTLDQIAINIGTSGAMRVCWPTAEVHVPTGLWCYRASRELMVMGGALSNGGDAFAWCVETLNIDRDGLEERLSGITADGHGLTVLPFFSGERSTGWADYARAAIAGMSLSTTPIEILRAVLESVAYGFAGIYDRLQEELPAPARIVASGGAAHSSPLWAQMLADVIGVPVAVSDVREASSRGAALLALEALGRVSDLNALETPFAAVHQPDSKAHDSYAQGRARCERLYDLLIAPGAGVLELAVADRSSSRSDL